MIASSSDSSVKKSLQEIASLLLMIHDHYFGDGDVLEPLIQFIADVHLSGTIALTDVERLRADVMPGQDSESQMGYEKFYDWLRRIGQLLYFDQYIDGKRALHQLLIGHIIPFATKLSSNQQAISQRAGIVAELAIATDPAFAVMVDCSEFILLLFREIQRKDEDLVAKDTSGCIPLMYGNLWREIAATGSGCIMHDSLIQTLLDLRIVPSFISLNRARILLHECCGLSFATSAGGRLPVTFLQFMELLLKIASGIDEAQGIGYSMQTKLSPEDTGEVCYDDYERIAAQKRMIVLLSHLARRKLHNVLALLHDAASIRSRAESDIPAPSGASGASYSLLPLEEDHRSMEMQSLLWWGRQSGLTNLPAVNVNWLRNQFEIYADTAAAAGPSVRDVRVKSEYAHTLDDSSSRWKISSLPYALFKIVERATELPVQAIRSHSDVFADYLQNSTSAASATPTTRSRHSGSPIVLSTAIGGYCSYIAYCVPTLLFNFPAGRCNIDSDNSTIEQTATAATLRQVDLERKESTELPCLRWLRTHLYSPFGAHYGASLEGLSASFVEHLSLFAAELASEDTSSSRFLDYRELLALPRGGVVPHRLCSKLYIPSIFLHTLREFVRVYLCERIFALYNAAAVSDPTTPTTSGSAHPLPMKDLFSLKEFDHISRACILEGGHSMGSSRDDGEMHREFSEGAMTNEQNWLLVQATIAEIVFCVAQSPSLAALHEFSLKKLGETSPRSPGTIKPAHRNSSSVLASLNGVQQAQIVFLNFQWLLRALLDDNVFMTVFAPVTPSEPYSGPRDPPTASNINSNSSLCGSSANNSINSDVFAQLNPDEDLSVDRSPAKDRNDGEEQAGDGIVLAPVEIELEPNRSESPVAVATVENRPAVVPVSMQNVHNANPALATASSPSHRSSVSPTPSLSDQTTAGAAGQLQGHFLPFRSNPLREVCILLMHYPLVSFELNPWEIARLCTFAQEQHDVRWEQRQRQQQLFHGSSGNNIGNAAANEPPSSHQRAESVLKLLLQNFSVRFGVSSHSMSKFFGAFYEAIESEEWISGKDGPFEMSQASSSSCTDHISSRLLANPAMRVSSSGALVSSKQQAIASSSFDLLMQERSLKLLVLNADLLKWEFVRCRARFRVCRDPFTEGLPTPLSSSVTVTNRSSDTLLSAATARSWAIAISSVEPDTVESLLQRVLCLSEGGAKKSEGAKGIDRCESVNARYLTFSSFVIFAVQCFTSTRASSPSSGADTLSGTQSKRLTDAEKDGTEQFIDGIRAMLQQFSISLTRVQQSVRIRVLRPLFGGGKEYAKEPLDSTDRTAIVSSAHSLFAEFMTESGNAWKAVGAAGTRAGSESGPSSAVAHRLRQIRSSLPPRPPTQLWDFPRFAQFSKFLGLGSASGAEQFNDLSMEAICVAFALSQSSGSNAPSARIEGGKFNAYDVVVPPTPVKAAIDTVSRMLDCVAWVAERSASFHRKSVLLTAAKDSGSGGGADDDAAVSRQPSRAALTALFFKVITPAICAYEDCKGDPSARRPSSTAKSGGRTGAGAGAFDVSLENPLLEDLLRYGGSEVLATLSSLQDFVRLSYFALLEQAAVKIRKVHLNELSADADVQRGGESESLIKRNECGDLEVPLNLACKFFSCSGIVRIGSIAIQAKRSLSLRLRPVFVGLSGSNIQSTEPSEHDLLAERNQGISTQSNEILTLSLSEYEELFLRTAFALWEESGAVFSPQFRVKAANLRDWAKEQAQQQTLLSHPVAGDGDPLLVERIAQMYSRECEKEFERHTARKADRTAVGQLFEGRTATSARWGIDFLRPYAMILQMFSEFTKKTLNTFKHVGGLGKSPPLMLLLPTDAEVNPLSTENEGRHSTEPAPLRSNSGPTPADNRVDLVHPKPRLGGVNRKPLSIEPNDTIAHAMRDRAGMSQDSATPSSYLGNAHRDSHEAATAGAPTGAGAGGRVLPGIMDMRLQYAVADPGVRRRESGATVDRSSPSSELGSNTGRTTGAVAAPRVYAYGGQQSSLGIGDPTIPANSRKFFPAESDRGVLPPQYHTRQHPSMQPLPQYEEGMKGRQSPESISGASTFTAATAATVGSSSPTKLRSSKSVIEDHRERMQERQQSSQRLVGALDALLKGAKEALWPVYATYCSCGDSLDPGKLSGPNLFTLLSKLGVLTDRTLLSDVGVLLHQISAHSFTSSSMTVSMLQGGDYHLAGAQESPSLSYEEFLVFLCAYSQLRFEGVVVNLRGDEQETNTGPLSANSSFSSSASGLRSLEGGSTKRSDHHRNNLWLRRWQEFMSSSKSFSRLLKECVLPILEHETLLAFPEDARLRDRFAVVFSLEVLLAIEGAERSLQIVFERERSRSAEAMAVAIGSNAKGGGSGDSSFSSVSSISPASAMVSPHKMNMDLSVIIDALKRIKLIPTVINESQVLQLIKDVMPEQSSALRRSQSGMSASAAGVGFGDIAGTGGRSNHWQQRQQFLLFPQWEWVLCVIAFQAVETAVQQSSAYTDPKKIPSLVADVIASIALAMTQ